MGDMVLNLGTKYNGRIHGFSRVIQYHDTAALSAYIFQGCKQHALEYCAQVQCGGYFAWCEFFCFE